MKDVEALLPVPIPHTEFRLARGIRAGRESLFAFDPKPIDAMRQYLEEVSRQWDQPLARLKAFVEK